MKPDGNKVDNELVPLSIAAQVVYFHISGIRGDVLDERPLGEVVRVTVIALSQLAPIYSVSSEGPPQLLAAQQLDLILVRPLQEKGAQPDLDLFQIRRGDLRQALASLRNKRSG